MISDTSYYLSHLGIVIWVPNKASKETTSEDVLYPVVMSSNVANGVVFLSSSAVGPMQLELMSNIMKACGFTSFITLLNVSDAKVVQMIPKYIVIFSEDLDVKVDMFGHSFCILTSLDTILSFPSAKTTVWLKLYNFLNH